MNRRLMPVAFALALATGVARADNPVTIGEGIVVPPRMVSSRTLGEERAVYIALPVSYARTQRRYPVLYLTDAAEKFMHTQATAAFLARNGLMPEVIVVAVGNTDRPRDLTPSRNEARPTSGGADRFLEFFEKELIPYMESHYRTAPFRIFAGHSLGGLFALHSMRAKPGLFDAVIAVSPWLQWDGRKEQALLKAFFAGDGVKTRVLFYASGNEGKAMSEGVEALAKGLEPRKGNGLRVGSAHFPDENHGSVVLPAHYAAFRMIFEGWAMPLDAAGKESPVTLEQRQEVLREPERAPRSRDRPSRSDRQRRRLCGARAAGRSRCGRPLSLQRRDVSREPGRLGGPGRSARGEGGPPRGARELLEGRGDRKGDRRAPDPPLPRGGREGPRGDGEERVGPVTGPDVLSPPPVGGSLRGPSAGAAARRQACAFEARGLAGREARSARTKMTMKSARRMDEAMT